MEVVEDSVIVVAVEEGVASVETAGEEASVVEIEVVVEDTGIVEDTEIVEDMEIVVVVAEVRITHISDPASHVFRIQQAPT